MILFEDDANLPQGGQVQEGGPTTCVPKQGNG